MSGPFAARKSGVVDGVRSSIAAWALKSNQGKLKIVKRDDVVTSSRLERELSATR
ncbi:hypothetical protein M422DRAFT_258113 [Sphaerobolus stellatus SS14]|uniref:Uncharacterized protein n=1 Tax=Sphaerobolus stellatus (strain SS14) TaxID=990650 RepID=A0A0C9UWI2_SPHS4|nr:hypothetical protein M422DRAFT_258113 [Sphaerobolus stellatus SS14]